MEAVLALCHETLGDAVRITLNARLLLGVANRCAGHLDLASEHIDVARIGLTRGFGSKSSETLACRLSQALNWLALQRYLEARMALEEVLAVYENRVGPTHPNSLICTLDIATALFLEENYPAAESRVRSALDGLQERLGATHPYTLAAKMVLASVLASQGKLAEAGELEETVVAGRQLVLGSQHPDTLRCRVNLLLTRHALGVGGADQERQEIIDDLAGMIGSEHADVSTALKGNRLLCVVDPQPF
jgi:tetratricopeptide (TPR) repeat protein